MEATDEVQINSLSSSSLPKLIIDFVKNNNKRAELLVIAGGGISFSDEIAKVETILNTPFENIDDFLEILTSFKSFLSIRTVFNENVGIK